MSFLGEHQSNRLQFSDFRPRRAGAILNTPPCLTPIDPIGRFPVREDLMRRSFALALLVLSVSLPASIAMAQDENAEPVTFDRAPAHIEFLEGSVTVDHDGRSEAAVSTGLLIPGDRVRTDVGRAEILFGDNSALYVDEHTTLDLLSESLIRLMEGRVTIVVAAGDVSTSPRYQIDTPAATVTIDVPGEYRIAQMPGADGSATRLLVVRGSAQLANDRGAMNLRPGEVSVAAENEAPGLPQIFNAARWDDFDRWSYARQQSRLGVVSSRYLPSDVQPYAATFDQYGSWGQDPAYGSVWYPTAAYSGWRPYSNGYWNFFGGFGWTWIGHDRWAWPTHHYGRWGFRANSWFWIPSRRWSPGYVHWATAPGYVSWCPLGFNGQPVFSFWNHRGVGGWNDPWRGWTVVPRQSFGLNTRVTVAAIDGRRLTPGVRAGFALHGRVPFQPYAVPRGRLGSSTFVGAPTYSNRGSRIVNGPRVPSGQFSNRTPLATPRRGTLSVLGTPGRRATTRIDSPAPPYYGGSTYGGSIPYRSAPVDDPYARADRVARERMPGLNRQPLRSGYGPTGNGSASPYPPQFRSTAPEPFRYVPESSRSNGGVPRGVYERRGAVPATGGSSGSRMMTPGPSPDRTFSSPGRTFPSGGTPRGNGIAMPRGPGPGSGGRSGMGSPSPGPRMGMPLPPSTSRGAVPR